MSGGGRLDQLQRKAVIGLFQHMECLPETQITQDIHGKVITPVRHIPRPRPALLARTESTIRDANLLAESPDIAKDVALHVPHSIIREGMRQHTALPRMELLVARVVRVGGRVDEGVVELGLAHVGAEAVDVLEGLVGVEGDGVGPEPDSLACAGVSCIVFTMRRVSYRNAGACARTQDGGRLCRRGRVGMRP